MAARYIHTTFGGVDITVTILHGFHVIVQYNTRSIYYGMHQMYIMLLTVWLVL